MESTKENEPVKLAIEGKKLVSDSGIRRHVLIIKRQKSIGETWKKWLSFKNQLLN